MECDPVWDRGSDWSSKRATSARSDARHCKHQGTSISSWVCPKRIHRQTGESGYISDLASSNSPRSPILWFVSLVYMLSISAVYVAGQADEQPFKQAYGSATLPLSHKIGPLHMEPGLQPCSI